MVGREQGPTIEIFSDLFDFGPGVPQERAERLLRLGYIRIDQVRVFSPTGAGPLDRPGPLSSGCGPRRAWRLGVGSAGCGKRHERPSWMSALMVKSSSRVTRGAAANQAASFLAVALR
ncbi:hypothetical protein GCM10023198_57270 [Promicromonospora umidemergens]|uniref:Uncharacterized protein n=1 Tax=Promicromonospora umidemergens TaxID=629679 RepID=A0ABP8Y9L5_9MICO